MHVHGHTELLASGPKRIVDGVVQRFDPFDVRRHVRQQDTSAQTVLLDPANVLDRIINIVEEDLSDPSSAFRKFITEILQPTIMGLNTGPALVVLFGGRGLGEEDEAREERRNGVWENDFSDDPISFLLLIAEFVVPVAEAPIVAEILIRILVGATP